MRYWLGLGANLGDRLDNIARALACLAERGLRIEAVSGVWETAPQEREDQPPFLNASCRMASDLDPSAVLDIAKSCEDAVGRQPTMRFGPRVVDVDLLLWEGGIWSSPGLEIPHPRLAGRRFALLPLLELDPELTLPDGRRLPDLAAAISSGDQPARRLDEGVGWLGAVQ